MCDACQMSGLERSCSTCPGFDWVEDVYVWEKNPDEFEGRRCDQCREAWARVMAGSR